MGDGGRTERRIKGQDRERKLDAARVERETMDQYYIEILLRRVEKERREVRIDR